jgi:hypothetical protein
MSFRLRVLAAASIGCVLGFLAARSRTFGNPKEWALFRKHHGSFFKVAPELQDLIEKLFRDQPSADTAQRKLVFLLGCLCWEDFREILLLCSNGYGIAASRILRSLYEHAVTAHHIAKHPENADLFDDFVHVQNKKIIDHAAVILTPDQLLQHVSQERQR